MVSDKKRLRKISLLIFISLILLTIILFSKIIGIINHNVINTSMRFHTRRLITFILIRLPSSNKLYADNLSQEIINDFVARNEGLRLIIIDKTIRKLYLYENNLLVAGFPFPIALGFDPVNKKERSGDGRTPEGEYFYL